MILKGGPREGTASYTKYIAAHLQRVDHNERMVIREIRGTAANDVLGAFREMAAYGAACRCERPFYHLAINAGPAEAPFDEAQKLTAVEMSEQELGLTGQPRVVVEHVKDGRVHLHVMWCRIDVHSLRPISSSFNYRRHEAAARHLEEEFGHVRVQGAHVGRIGVARPERRPSDVELRQADRSRVNPAVMKANVTAAWRTADTGRAFRTAIEAEGDLLARGDRRGFVLVDRTGGMHSLARRVEGAKASEIRARMSDLDAATLPSVAQARAEQEAASAAWEVRDRESAVGAQLPDPNRRAPVAPNPQTARASEPNPLSIGLPPVDKPSAAAPPIVEPTLDTPNAVLIVTSEVDAGPVKRRRYHGRPAETARRRHSDGPQ